MIYGRSLHLCSCWPLLLLPLEPYAAALRVVTEGPTVKERKVKYKKQSANGNVYSTVLLTMVTQQSSLVFGWIICGDQMCYNDEWSTRVNRKIWKGKGIHRVH